MRFFDLSHRVLNICLMIFQYSWYNLRLAHFGWRSVIESPLKINGTRNIHIDRNVRIAYKTWLAPCHTPAIKPGYALKPGQEIGHFNHIYATQSILIEKNVLTAWQSLHFRQYPQLYKHRFTDKRPTHSTKKSSRHWRRLLVGWECVCNWRLYRKTLCDRGQ